MTWFIIAVLFLIIILLVILSIVFACMLSGQRCTISFQRRTPNHELTRIQQENEQKQFSSKFKRLFRSSSKPEQLPAPVEDVKTIEFTFKLHDDQKASEQITVINEPAMTLLPQTYSNQARRDEREKRREALREKYKL